jgi:hypothetical protein
MKVLKNFDQWKLVANISNSMLSRFFSFFTLFILLTTFVYAIDIPEVSFYGEEISSYYVGPSFAAIDISYDNKTSYETYLEKITIESEHIKESEYGAKKPGFMYSGRFLTGFASIFVGDKAFRNYIVKKFLNKDYYAVISGYEDYEKKLEDSKYIDEVKLLYSLSLKMTGNISKALEILIDMSSQDSEFARYAQDNLFKYLFEIRDYDKLLKLKDNIKKFSPFSLYITLKVLLDKNMYSQILDLLNTNTMKDKVFDQFAIVAYYYEGEYEKVLQYKNDATKQTIFFIIDAAINLEEVEYAKNLMVTLNDSEMINYFNGRLAILNKDITTLEKCTNALVKDKNKLNLMFLYLQKYFPDIDLAFLDAINFSEMSYKDYVYFYSALYSLKQKDYLTAVSFLQRITFNPELMREANFYLGLAYINLDKSRAEHFLTKYINDGNNKKKIDTARYFLGNLYLIQGKTNDALVITNTCEEPYCIDLKARIFINKGDFDRGIELANRLSDDRKYYYYGVINYNKREYGKALEFLQKIEKPDVETNKLMMLTFFKLKRIEDALNILRKYKELPDFKKEAVDYLFLSGEYDKVLNLTADERSPYLLLIRAKSLYSLKKYNEAMKAFENLLKYKDYLYDCVLSLINIYDKLYKGDAYIDKCLSLISKYNFDKKDALLVKLINQTAENNVNMAIGLINYFLDQFKDSHYIDDVYLARAKIFHNIKKDDQCLTDTNYLLKKNPENTEALYIQALCYESVDKKKAGSIYSKLVTLDNAYTDVSYKKIIEFSTDKNALLRAAKYFEKSDESLYIKAMVKFLDLEDIDKLGPYEDFINKLKSYKSPRIVSVGYYLYGKLLEGKKQYGKAADNYMKSYYIYEKSEYSKSSLKRAYEIYKKINDDASASKIKKMLK